MLKIGDRAPNWDVLNQHGELVALAEHRGHRVLLFFYPKADTPGCTEQSCLLRDIVTSIGDTAIVGVSPDKPGKQAKFDVKHSLGFTLLSDIEHAVAEAYGVWQEKMLYGKTYMGIIRSAFLIDEDGLIEQAWYKISPKDTPTNLLAALGVSA
jgi:thioredoxin-dependent peroxiredoxin